MRPVREGRDAEGWEKLSAQAEHKTNLTGGNKVNGLSGVELFKLPAGRPRLHGLIMQSNMKQANHSEYTQQLVFPAMLETHMPVIFPLQTASDMFSHVPSQTHREARQQIRKAFIPVN